MGTRLQGWLFCWGQNNFGQVGNGNFNTALSPVNVSAGLGPWQSLSLGSGVSCGIPGPMPNLTVRQGAPRDLIVPCALATLPPSLLYPFALHAHTLCSGPVSYIKCQECWGSNAFGAYGSGNTAVQTMPSPTNISDALRWSRYFVSVAGGHYAGLQASDSSLWLW